jgi:hypothetical protein
MEAVPQVVIPEDHELTSKRHADLMQEYLAIKQVELEVTQQALSFSETFLTVFFFMHRTFSPKCTLKSANASTL